MWNAVRNPFYFHDVFLNETRYSMKKNCGAVIDFIYLKLTGSWKIIKSLHFDQILQNNN